MIKTDRNRIGQTHRKKIASEPNGNPNGMGMFCFDIDFREYKILDFLYVFIQWPELQQQFIFGLHMPFGVPLVVQQSTPHSCWAWVLVEFVLRLNRGERERERREQRLNRRLSDWMKMLIIWFVRNETCVRVCKMFHFVVSTLIWCGCYVAYVWQELNGARSKHSSAYSRVQIYLMWTVRNARRIFWTPVWCMRGEPKKPVQRTWMMHDSVCTWQWVCICKLTISRHGT